jgi:malonyl-CoA O-methyltransferase
MQADATASCDSFSRHTHEKQRFSLVCPKGIGEEHTEHRAGMTSAANKAQERAAIPVMKGHVLFTVSSPVYCRAMRTPLAIATESVKRQFDRRAASMQAADFLLREIERRMFERLDLIKLVPEHALDLGCGAGAGLQVLRQRFPQAQLTGLELAPKMALRAQQAVAAAQPSALTRIVKRLGNNPVGSSTVRAGDAHAIPLPDSALQLIWSNLAFHWFADPLKVLAECKRTLRADGLLMLSFFGVDTAKELRALGVELPTFQDMHDVGDALVNLGFAQPVVDMETLTFTYTDAAALLADVRAIGGNPLVGRGKGLHTPRQKQQWLASLSPLKALTIEVVYVHAWLPAKSKLPEGYAPIGFR